jgi:hypothetical protein
LENQKAVIEPPEGIRKKGEDLLLKLRQKPIPIFPCKFWIFCKFPLYHEFLIAKAPH